jgi:hypothetical protein
MNTALFINMIDRYNKHSFTHEYIFGFAYKGNVYMTFANSGILPAILTLDKASRGAGYSLRFKPNNSIKVALLANAELICSEAYFEELFRTSKYNRGEIFEKMVTERFGQVWEKDNIPFTDDGDLTVNGIAYQIKYQKATFVTEAGLANIEK